MTPQAIWMIIVFTRQCAHVGEYAVLALLMWRALRRGIKRVHAETGSVWCSLAGVRPVCRERRISPDVC